MLTHIEDVPLCNDKHVSKNLLLLLLITMLFHVNMICQNEQEGHSRPNERCVALHRRQTHTESSMNFRFMIDEIKAAHREMEDSENMRFYDARDKNITCGNTGRPRYQPVDISSE